MALPDLTVGLLVAHDEARDVFAAGGQRLGEVLLHMRQAMEELGEAPVRAALGGALTGAQNEGRLTAAVNAELPGAVFADETRDANTCPPCKDIDERYLGSTDEMDEVRQHYPGGGFGGYIGCDGRERCRGTIRFEWPPGRDPIVPPELGEPEPELDVDEAERAIQEAMTNQAEADRVAERAAEVEQAVKRKRRKAAKVAPKAPAKLPDRADDLRALIATEGDATHRHDVSGLQGRTEIVTVPGGKFVSKQIHSWDDDEGKTTVAESDTDKEELANAVARAIGVDVPALVRAGPTHLYLEFVDGPVGGAVKVDDKRDVVKSDAGEVFGLFDIVVANSDRHDGNWLVRDGRPVAIDHGYTWSPLGARSDFGGSIANLAGALRPENDMSPADMVLVRERVAMLRPDFDRLGRGAWFDQTMGIIGQVAERATGTRDRVKR